MFLQIKLVKGNYIRVEGFNVARRTSDIQYQKGDVEKILKLTASSVVTETLPWTSAPHPAFLPEDSFAEFRKIMGQSHKTATLAIVTVEIIGEESTVSSKISELDLENPEALQIDRYTIITNVEHEETKKQFEKAFRKHCTGHFGSRKVTGGLKIIRPSALPYDERCKKCRSFDMQMIEYTFFCRQCRRNTESFNDPILHVEIITDDRELILHTSKILGFSD
ncbi:hypothetical protein R1flu_020198 [Riccia fluitans]|uniref:Uncharacterized protein n=1 Tax=Riccia fluitans TaxID=41844 RepID=A0ABD1ZMA4_9MARC